MRTLLVAEEAAGLRALRLLASREGVDPVAVLTSPPPERGQSVASAAAELGLPRLEPGLVADAGFAEWIVEHDVDLLLNVHSLSIAAGQVLAAPRIGSFNLHPGPLPAYAGLNAPSWAIAAGEKRHAVTLHWMTATVDAGDVAYEAWFDIAADDTGLRVATRCAREGLPLIARLLDDAAAGSIPAVPQAPGGRWFGREVPHGGRVPWELGSAAVTRVVRAADYAPFASPWGTFVTRASDGADVEIVRLRPSGEPTAAPSGTVGPARGDIAAVSAGDEWVLVERVRRDGTGIAPSEVLTAGWRCD
ncbi:MAG: hypothetical protein GXY03_12910 [Solirubrobacterales bacterium]|nr:hypothetical protein [Solirubrobacterales bacterium]